MNIRRFCARTALALTMAVLAVTAYAQQKEIKIGVIYDYTGPLAAGGSLPGAMGTKAAIEMINERGGIEGYKINAIYADAQSKPDVAINEMTRLIEQEKVDLILGVFSSAHCVPMAQLADSKKKMMWATICVASSVVKDKKLTHFFRVQVHSDQYGETSCKFLNENAKAKLGKDPKDLKVAIIYEDGPYGAGIGASNETNCKALGIQVALKEGYSATAPDLSSLITKLRRANADVILHTGYNPDITLFWRQAREQGLKWSALIGHGAGYAQYDKLHSAFGKAHTCMHPPQFEGSDARFASQPFAGLLSQSAQPGLTEHLVEHDPFSQNAVPLAAKHGFPHAPQFFASLPTCTSQPSLAF